MKFLFPYMARWKAINWTRYQRIFTMLAEQGHTIHVIQMPASNTEETNFQEIQINLSPNIHIHELDFDGPFWRANYPFNKIFRKGFFSLACIPAVKKMVKQYDIDVLVVYNLTQYPLIKSVNCLTVFDYADDYVDMLKFELGVFRNPLFIGIARSILHRLVKEADLTLTISHVLADSLRGIRNVQVVPNGVDLGKFNPNAVKEIEQKFQSPVVGFLGSFEYFIDFDVILQAAKNLPEYVFLMIGSGRRFGEVERKVKQMNLNNVVLTGSIPFHQVPAYINSMDVCLNIFKDMPVSHSASPIKLFEYIALKKPVISTRLKEVKNIDRGFMYYADTAEELTETLQHVMVAQDERAKRVDAAFECVEQEFQWNDIVTVFLDAIVKKQQLVQKRAARPPVLHKTDSPFTLK